MIDGKKYFGMTYKTWISMFDKLGKYIVKTNFGNLYVIKRDFSSGDCRSCQFKGHCYQDDALRSITCNCIFNPKYAKHNAKVITKYCETKNRSFDFNLIYGNK